MSSTSQEIRNVVQYLILEGLDVSVAEAQRLLKEKQIAVSDEQVDAIIREEGGPFPAYQGYQG